jgi:hypothetical protein
MTYWQQFERRLTESRRVVSITSKYLCRKYRSGWDKIGFDDVCFGRYVIEWRYVHNDVSVTPWELLAVSGNDPPVGKYSTPQEAYEAACALLHTKLVVASLDDIGNDYPGAAIRTERWYAGATVFQHPEDTHYQYRIVEEEK